MKQAKFLYFDLGKVLVDFDLELMFRQMGEVARVEPAVVREVLFGAGGLQKQYEAGQVSSRQFHERFCRETGTRPDFDKLVQAGSDIFELNTEMLPIIAGLGQAGHRLGILSNTCDAHWEHCRRRFPVLGESFAVHALSYRMGAAKPDEVAFRGAAELAGQRAEDIFFVDDLEGNVAGAVAAGFDAVQYTSTPQLLADLRQRGIDLQVG
jgi:FMN phosphatase YigB (HAD superfamily)